MAHLKTFIYFDCCSSPSCKVLHALAIQLTPTYRQEATIIKRLESRM